MIAKANSIVQHGIQIKRGIMKRQCECKNYCAKKSVVGILAHVFVTMVSI